MNFLAHPANDEKKKEQPITHESPTSENNHRETVVNVADDHRDSNQFDLDDHEPIYQPEDPGEPGENEEEPVVLHEEL